MFSCLLATLWLFACVEAQKGVATADENRSDNLRWFPADVEEDCDKEPGLEQVRRGEEEEVTMIRYVEG